MMDVQVVAAMARDAEWLDSEACAFLLGLRNRRGEVNARGFMESVAVREGFPCPAIIAGRKHWRRVDVMRWAEDEAKISGRAA